MPLNTVGIFFPNNMNQMEKTRSFEVIDDLLAETSFHISFYQAPEQEILEYIIQVNENLFSHFHIHLFTKKNDFSLAIKNALDFFESLGGNIIEHNLPVNDSGFADRKNFEKFSASVLEKTDELLVFYNNDPNQITKLLMPISIAESKGKTPYICKNNLGKEITLFERQLLN